MPLDLESERFSASGGTAAKGVLNQLGRPSADRLTLLVREAVQNSWDARRGNGELVHFQVDGYTLDQARKQDILQEVFAEEAHGIAVRKRLLSAEPLHMIALSDFGTLGLGGPTRSDVVPAQGEPTHFINLVRNLGQPTDRQFSGGTYGFGKAASYLASELSTIALFSRHRDAGGVHSRFIAAALGDDFETAGEQGRRFTGRHWWGRRSAGDPVVAPVDGDDASRLATLFGAPERGPEATGTTVFVLAPILEGLAPLDAMERIASTLTYYFWPKLVDGPGGNASMSFCVRWNGDDIQLPTVQSDPNLGMFAAAFAATMRGSAPDAKVHAVASLKPKRHLGKAGFVERFAQPVTQDKEAPHDDEAPVLPSVVLETPLQHIAVMREPHFVVKYLRGPGVTWAIKEYAGVFIADQGLDATFARAEPPTHDDWVADLLTDAGDKTAVRVTHTRIKGLMDAIAAPAALEAPPYVDQPLAEFSQLLGALIPAVEPPGNRRRSEAQSSGRNGKGDTSTRDKSKAGGASPFEVEVTGRPELDTVDGQRFMRISFRVKGPAGRRCVVSATAKVQLLDGVEKDPPEGAELPRVLAWRSSDARLLAQGGDEFSLSASDDGYLLDVSLPRDATVTVTLDAAAVA